MKETLDSSSVQVLSWICRAESWKLMKEVGCLLDNEVDVSHCRFTGSFRLDDQPTCFNILSLRYFYIAMQRDFINLLLSFYDSCFDYRATSISGIRPGKAKRQLNSSCLSGLNASSRFMPIVSTGQRRLTRFFYYRYCGISLKPRCRLQNVVEQSLAIDHAIDIDADQLADVDAKRLDAAPLGSWTPGS